MHRVGRSLLAFSLIFTAAIIAPAESKNTSPQVVEVRDAAMQQSYFEDREPPRDCSGSKWNPNGQICWAIYPRVWQTFDKEQKGLDLVVNFRGTGAGTNFTSASLLISVDGKVTRVLDAEWVLGHRMWDGSTLIIKDESLIRSVASGSDVQFTVESVKSQSHFQYSIKLSSKTSESMRAVLAKFDTLN